MIILFLILLLIIYLYNINYGLSSNNNIGDYPLINIRENKKKDVKKKNYDTEIHFITFWEKNNKNAKSRLNKEI